MSGDIPSAPVPSRLMTRSMYLLIGLTLAGMVATLYRFIFGLEAATNLTNQYPWGIWKAIGVAAGVALATGGFTTAALVHIFHRYRYAPVARFALLIGIVGYTFGVVSLGVDIGRYYNIWHPAWPTMWQGRSVLFEVAMCIMAYFTILYIELTPILCERYMGRVNLPGRLAALNGATEAVLRAANAILEKILPFFVLIGVVLSCMHHSSLGALMLVAPSKMHALWYTPVLPLLFLLSVFAVGFAIVIAVAIPTWRALGRKPNMSLFGHLSHYVLFFLFIYMMAKISDMLIRETYTYLFTSSEGFAYLLEMLVGVLIPIALLASSRVRRSAAALSSTCWLVVIGLVINRVNVFLVAYQSLYSHTRYFPSWAEILTTSGLLAFFIILFRIGIAYLPILPAETRPAPMTRSALQAAD